MATETISYIYNLKDNMSRTLNDIKNKANEVDSKISITDKGIRGLKTAGIVGAAGFTALATAAVFGVKNASDLNETINKSNVIFKDGASEIERWAETAINQTGASKNANLEAASSFGNLATAMGLPQGEIVPLSKELTVLAADLGSFNNVSQEVAANALTGIFTGEAESLKQFGIILNDSTINQTDYAKSINKTASEMNQQEKIQARLEVVTKATTTAQGDFANTNKSLANALKIAKAQFENISTVLDEKLLPKVTEITNSLNDGLAVALALITGDTTSLTTEQLSLYNSMNELKNTILGLKEEFIAIGIVIGLLSLLWLAFNVNIGASSIASILATGGLSGLTVAIWSQVTALLAQAAAFLIAYWPILLIIAGIGLLVYAYLEFESVQKIVNTTIQITASLIQILAAIIKTILITAWYLLQTVVLLVWEQIKLSVGIAMAYIQLIVKIGILAIVFIWNTIVAAIQLVWDIIVAIAQFGINLIIAIVDLFVTYWIATWDVIKANFQATMELIRSIFEAVVIFWQTIIEAFKLFWSGVWDIIKGIFTGDTELIKQGFGKMGEAFNKVLEAFKTFWSTIWTSIKTYFNTIMDNMKTYFSTIWEKMKSIVRVFRDFFKDIWNAIKGFFKSVWDSMKTTANNVLNAIKGFITSVTDKFKTAWNNVINGVKRLFDGFKSKVSGVFDSIKGAITTVTDFFKNAWSGAVETVKNLIGGIVDKVKSIGDFLNPFGGGKSTAKLIVDNNYENQGASTYGTSSKMGTSSNYQTTSNNYNYNISYDKAPNLRDLRHQRVAFNSGGF